MKHDTELAMAVFGISSLTAVCSGFLLMVFMERDMDLLRSANSYMVDALNIAGGIVDAE